MFSSQAITYINNQTQRILQSAVYNAPRNFLTSYGVPKSIISIIEGYREIVPEKKLNNQNIRNAEEYEQIRALAKLYYLSFEYDTEHYDFLKFIMDLDDDEHVKNSCLKGLDRRYSNLNKIWSVESPALLIYGDGDSRTWYWGDAKQVITDGLPDNLAHAIKVKDVLYKMNGCSRAEILPQREILNELLKQHNPHLVFPRVNLLHVKLNFHGLNLRGANFKEAWLWLDVKDTDLSGATFHGGKIVESAFYNTSLAHAQFKSVKSLGQFRSIEISDCTFNEVYAPFAKFEGTSLKEVTMKDCDFSHAYFSKYVSTSGSLTNIQLNYATLQDTYWEFKMENVNMSSALIDGARLSFNSGMINFCEAYFVNNAIPLEPEKKGGSLVERPLEQYKSEVINFVIEEMNSLKPGNYFQPKGVIFYDLKKMAANPQHLDFKKYFEIFTLLRSPSLEDISKYAAAHKYESVAEKARIWEKRGLPMFFRTRKEFMADRELLYSPSIVKKEWKPA